MRETKNTNNNSVKYMWDSKNYEAGKHVTKEAKH